MNLKWTLILSFVVFLLSAAPAAAQAGPACCAPPAASAPAEATVPAVPALDRFVAAVAQVGAWVVDRLVAPWCCDPPCCDPPRSDGE